MASYSVAYVSESVREHFFFLRIRLYQDRVTKVITAVPVVQERVDLSLLHFLKVLSRGVLYKVEYAIIRHGM